MQTIKRVSKDFHDLTFNDTLWNNQPPQLIFPTRLVGTPLGDASTHPVARPHRDPRIERVRDYDRESASVIGDKLGHRIGS